MNAPVVVNSIRRGRENTGETLEKTFRRKARNKCNDVVIDGGSVVVVHLPQLPSRQVARDKRANSHMVSNLSRDSPVENAPVLNLECAKPAAAAMSTVPCCVINEQTRDRIRSDEPQGDTLYMICQSSPPAVTSSCKSGLLRSGHAYHQARNLRAIIERRRCAPLHR